MLNTGLVTTTTYRCLNRGLNSNEAVEPSVLQDYHSLSVGVESLLSSYCRCQTVAQLHPTPPDTVGIWLCIAHCRQLWEVGTASLYHKEAGSSDREHVEQSPDSV